MSQEDESKEKGRLGRTQPPVTRTVFDVTPSGTWGVWTSSDTHPESRLDLSLGRGHDDPGRFVYARKD